MVYIILQLYVVYYVELLRVRHQVTILQFYLKKTNNMTQRRLLIIIRWIGAFYVFFILIGIGLRIFDSTKDQIIYSTFKDLIPLFFAVPLGYLGFCFQRRNSFMNSLKGLWGNMIFAVNEAIQYTHRKKNSNAEYGEVLARLSSVIDELRSVYKNIDETESYIGLYPFEPLKDIRGEIEELGFGKLKKSSSERARDNILHNWKSIRSSFLHELDRVEPTKAVSYYKG